MRQSPFDPRKDNSERPPFSAFQEAGSSESGHRRVVGIGYKTPSLKECCFPRGNGVLLILLVALLPIMLLFFEDFVLPLFDLLQSAWSGEMKAMPWTYYLKLGSFTILSLFGLSQLLLRLQINYVSTWCLFFSRPHPLHVDYHPNLQGSLLALSSWYLFRGGTILLPPLLCGGITFTIVLTEMALSNFFLSLHSSLLPIEFILGMFLFLLFLMLTFFAFFVSGWTMLKTVFGSLIAITEPELPPKTVFDRCGRIAFSSPVIFFWYVLNALFLTAVVAEIIILWTTYDVQDMATWGIQWIQVTGLTCLTVGAYYLLTYLKFTIYHQALARYYNQLPAQVKEQFSPPPSLQHVNAFATFEVS